MARSVEAIVKDTLKSPELSEQVDTLRAELTEVRKTVSSLISTGSNVLSSRLSEGLTNASGQAQTLKAASLDSLNSAADRTRDASQATLDTIIAEARRNPARTLALTLGAGLLLGLWSRSRS